MNEKYLVVVDGLYDYYGTEIFFVGLFDTQEMANNAVDESIKRAKENGINFLIHDDFMVLKVDVNNIHDITMGDPHLAYTDIWIGGCEE